MVHVENNGTKRLYALMVMDIDGWLVEYLLAYRVQQFPILFCFLLTARRLIRDFIEIHSSAHLSPHHFIDNVTFKSWKSCS